MIYIVFDTNIWVYLANGYDSEKDNYYPGGYFDTKIRIAESVEEFEDPNQL